MPLIRSVSGLRATTSDGSFSEETIARHVRAFAQLQPNGPIAVGYDGRLGGQAFAELVAQELRRSDRQVLMLGCVPTPTVQVIVERNRLAGGVVVTASHNGAEWNGLKFLDSDGVFLSPERVALLWNRSDRIVLTEEISRGGCVNHTDPIGEHIGTIAQVDWIAERRAADAFADMRVVVDAVNASGSEALPRLIEWLGAQPIRLYCDGSGIFPHPPEPLPEHLGELSTASVQHRATIGIAVDPDADRLVLVHSSGATISEEKTIVLAAEAVLRHTGGGTVVVNASTTSEVEHIAHQYGAQVLRSAVGEANVVQMMRRCGAVVGGEGSGGVILPACHYGRDSLVGTALILMLRSLLSEDEWARRTLSSPVVMHKRKIGWSGNFADAQAALAAAFSDAGEIWTGDGIRFSWNDRWLHVRPSNTEPIVRMIAESPSDEGTIGLLNRATHIFQRYAS